MNQNAAVVSEALSDRSHAAAPFRALDPELPRLAARAAFQLDNLRLRAEGRDDVATNQEAIEQLAARLQAVASSAPSSSRRTRVDPVTTGVLHGAVLQSRQEPPKNLVGVLAQVGRLAEELSKIGRDQAEGIYIAELRDFCLAISELTASKQRLTRSPRPSRVPTNRMA